MDYYDLFHPILSFGAHLFLAAGAGEKNVASAFPALERHISAAQAKRRASSAEAFDQAWLPVKAWLDEKLVRLGLQIPDTALSVNKHGEARNDMGEEFFHELDRLLKDGEGDMRNSGRRDLVKIYHACLTLGFLGRYGHSPDNPELESYRCRCLDALAETTGGFLNHGDAAKPGVRMGKLRGMTVFWALPFLVAFGVFLLYRFLLADLFIKVFE